LTATHFTSKLEDLTLKLLLPAAAFPASGSLLLETRVPQVLKGGERAYHCVMHADVWLVAKVLGGAAGLERAVGGGNQDPTGHARYAGVCISAYVLWKCAIRCMQFVEHKLCVQPPLHSPRLEPPHTLLAHAEVSTKERYKTAARQRHSDTYKKRSRRIPSDDHNPQKR